MKIETRIVVKVTKADGGVTILDRNVLTTSGDNPRMERGIVQEALADAVAQFNYVNDLGSTRSL